MNGLKKHIRTFILFFIILSIAGCSAPRNNVEQNLVVALEAEVHTLDPGFLRHLNDQYVACNLWEGLVRKNINGLIEPGMADRWEISSDGLKYTFHLREDIYWSDGSPVNAAQFEYGWKRALDPDAQSAVAFMMYFLKNGEAYNKKNVKKDDVGVKALDDNTLEVTLEKSAPFFLEILNYHTYYPVRQDIVEKDPDSWHLKAHTLVSNGPFCVQNLDYREKILTVKNKYYWDEKNVKLNSITYTIERHPDAIWAQYLEGSVHFGDTFPTDIDMQNEIKNSKNNIISERFLATAYMCLNSRRAPFNNLKVRQALEMVIDKDEIVQNRGRLEYVANGFIPPGMPDAEPGTDFRTIGGKFMHEKVTADNISRAKELLKEAGYSGLEKFPTIVILATDPWKYTAEITAEQLRETLGINAEVRIHTSDIFYQQSAEGDYDIILKSWIADFADPVNFLGFLANEQSYKGIFPDEYYSLVGQANFISDNSQRFKILHEAEETLLNSYTLIPLFHLSNLYYIKPYVKDYLRTPLAEMYFRNAYMQNNTN